MNPIKLLLIAVSCGYLVWSAVCRYASAITTITAAIAAYALALACWLGTLA